MNQTTGRAVSHWRRLRTTRTAVIILLVVVVVLPGITGSVAFWHSRNLLVRQVEQGQAASAAALADALSRALDMAAAGAANAAARPELKMAAEQEDSAAMEAALRELHGVLPLYRTLAVVDGKGAQIAWWPHALATPSVATGTSRVNFDPHVAGTGAVVAMRFPMGAGTALVAETSVAAASPQLQEFRFGDTGTATLVRSDARVLLAGAAERRGQKVGAPEVRATVARLRPAQIEYFSPALQRRNIASFEPVPGQKLGVLVDMAEREAFADLTSLAWLIVAIVLVLTAIGLLVILVVGRRLASSEQDLRQARDAAERQALTDVLTGLGNRRALDEQLALAFDRVQRTGVPLAVTMLDLDHFKRLNDSRGHAAGDAALRTVANEIRGAVRSDDVAARVGGDEFALLHVDCTEEIATRVAARISDAVAQLGLLCDSKSGTPLTVSAGSAELHQGMTPAELLAAADANLYRAKSRRHRAGDGGSAWRLEGSG